MTSCSAHDPEDFAVLWHRKVFGIMGPGGSAPPVRAAASLALPSLARFDVDLDLVLLVLLLLLLAWYLFWTATRLDRLHARVEGTRHALDAQLQRRAAAATQLATSGLLDPASSLLLAESAHEAREAEPAEHEVRESELSRALRATLDDREVVDELEADPIGRALLKELTTACERVTLARRFHNDGVRMAVVVRRKRTVRWLRLAGRAALPQSFEMDDELPAAVR